MRSFYDLDVYIRSYKAALQVHQITKTFPKDEQFGLTSQIRRASRSIPANIAEGYAKRHSSDADMKRFLTIALGSSNEMLVWLDFCHDLGYCQNLAIQPLKQEYQELGRMLFSLAQNWKKAA